MQLKFIETRNLILEKFNIILNVINTRRISLKTFNWKQLNLHKLVV